MCQYKIPFSSFLRRLSMSGTTLLTKTNQNRTKMLLKNPKKPTIDRAYGKSSMVK